MVVIDANTVTVSQLIESLRDVPGDTPVIVTISSEYSTIAGNVQMIVTEDAGPNTPAIVEISAVDNYDPRQW